MNLGELGQQLRAVEGADGVQVRLELTFVRDDAGFALEQVVVELVGLLELLFRDLAQRGHARVHALVALRDGFHRHVGEQVVVAMVTERGGAHRIVGQVLLPAGFEQLQQRSVGGLLGGETRHRR